MKTRSTHLVVAALLALVGACGDDGDAPPPLQAGQAGFASQQNAAAAAAANAAALIPRVHIEDRVTVAERATIRHTFKDRDFAAETNRDPFQSFIVMLPGTPQAPLEPLTSQAGQQCTKADQLVATNYSYADLKLVGIVAQGTQRKVLMMDSGNLGHIIKRGDCVGKEKAVVKDIGTGYLTFVVTPDSLPNTSQRPAEEHSVQLHANDLPLMDYQIPTDNAPRPSVEPVMPPTAPATPAKPALPLPAPVPTPAGTPATAPAPAPASAAPSKH